MTRIKVLYLTGYDRCGSTLIARLLGDLPGCVAIGEAAGHFFSAPRSSEAPCGCGVSVTACPFWKDVRFPVEFQQMTADRFRLRNLPFIETQRKKHKPETDRFLESMCSLYERVAAKTSAQIIIDSSKNPVLARLLSLVPGIDLWVIHLLRDPRAVVSSYLRPKGYLPAISPPVVTSRWVAMALAGENLRRHVSRYSRLRYEDFVASPLGVIQEIAAGLGCSETVASITGATAELGSQHMLGGNPDKFERGFVKIVARPPRLPKATRVLVSLATAPLLWRYGYWNPRLKALHTSRHFPPGDSPSSGCVQSDQKDQIVKVSS